MVAMTAACSSGGGQTQAPSQAVEAGKDTAGGAEKDTAGGAGNAAAGGAEKDAAGGVTSAGSKGSGAKLDIAFCNVAPSSHPQNIAYRAFADKVKAETDGNISITVYDNAQMGNILELFQATIDGTIQMCIVPTSTLGSFDESLLVSDLPFLWPSAQIAIDVLTDESNGIAEDLVAGLTAKGTVCLGWQDNGYNSFANSTRPITCPEDMKGLTMRVPENQCDLAIVEACGASPTTMASNEVYTALQTGVVDGHYFGAIITMTGGYDEVTKYYTDDNHLLKLNAVFANTGWWEGLDQADREYLAQEITAMCREADQGCWKLEESILDQMEASDSIELHRLTDEERQQFVTVGESLWSRFDGVIDRELLTRIQDEIAKRK